jgi:hypothetical protein
VRSRRGTKNGDDEANGVLYYDHVRAEIQNAELNVLNVSGLDRAESTSFIMYEKNKGRSKNAHEFLDLLLHSRP